MQTGGNMELNEVSVAWLAGIVEGEAHFYRNPRVSKRKKPALHPGAGCAIRIQMCDLDVIERVCAMWGGRVSGPRNMTRNGRPALKKNGEPVLPLYETAVNGANAAAWMVRLYPLLGVRRRARIRELLPELFDHGNP